MGKVIYGYLIECNGMPHVFEDKSDMETFVRTFEIDVEADYRKPRRCEIHQFDALAYRHMARVEVADE